MSIEIVNLTPHEITLYAPMGPITIPSSGVARTSARAGAYGEIEGVPVPVYGPTAYGEVQGLPDPRPGVYYVVSAIVGSALRGTRPDVLCPGTGPEDGAVRDGAGRIVGVTRLVRTS